MTRPSLAAPLLIAPLLVACSAGSPAGSGAPAEPPATSSTPSPPAPAPTCPAAPPAAGTPWPHEVPQEVPTVPGAVLGAVTHYQGITYVKFSTSAPLRDGVLYVVKALPAAGFVLGRGDAERTEADAPFSSPSLLGSMRLTVVDDCSTEWLLATRPRDAVGGTPAATPTAPLVPYTPGASASPLPFG